MRRITILLKDNANVDLNALMNVAIEFNIETISEAKPEPEPRRMRKTASGFSAAEVIMSHYTPAGKFRSSDARAWITKEGFAEGTGASSLFELSKNNLIKKVGNLRPAQYEFVKPMASRPDLKGRGDGE